MTDAALAPDVEAMARAAADLAGLPPWEALSQWLHQYVGFAATKRALNEALMAANMKMLEGDIAALDRVVKVVAELDRYHGLAEALERRETAARPLALAGPPRPAPPSLPEPEPSAEAPGEGQICIARL